MAEVQEVLIEGIEPKQTGCGPVYEVPNPTDGTDDEPATDTNTTNP